MVIILTHRKFSYQYLLWASFFLKIVNREDDLSIKYIAERDMQLSVDCRVSVSTALGVPRKKAQ